MATNKVVYGNQTLIDLTNTTATADTVKGGYYFYGRNGVRMQGSYNPICLDANNTGSKFVNMTFYPFYFQSDEKIRIVNLNGWDVFGYTGSKAAILGIFEGNYSSGTLISSITIAAPPAGRENSFRILKCHVINSTQALITYQWDASDTIDSAISCRLITVKNGGILVQSSAMGISSSPSATVDVESWVMPMLKDNTSWILCRIDRTIATGANQIRVSRTWGNITTGALTMPSSNAWTSLASSNVLTQYSPPSLCRIARGGLFYTDNAGNPKLMFWHSDDSTIKNIEINDTTVPVNPHYLKNEPIPSDVSSSGGSFTIRYNYILGENVDGKIITCALTYLVTKYYDDDDDSYYIGSIGPVYLNVYLWDVDPITPVFIYESTCFSVQLESSPYSLRDLKITSGKDLYSWITNEYRKEVIIYCKNNIIMYRGLIFSSAWGSSPPIYVKNLRNGNLYGNKQYSGRILSLNSSYFSSTENSDIKDLFNNVVLY